MHVAKNLIVIIAVFWVCLESERHTEFPFWGIFWAIVAIKEGLLVFAGFFAVFCDLVGWGWVGIGAAFCDKLFSPFDVNFAALSLEIWTMVAALLWAFVPIETDPLHCVFYEFGSTFNIAGLVGIFDAQDISALVLLGNEVRING